jgi:hypothetical protein
MSETRITSLERCERGPRGEQGERGERGKHGKTGATGATGPTGPSIAFTPARTLFVAQSWPAGADPTIFFTSIAAAYAASAALTPTAANPVEILVYPGTYPDPITIVSNVHLFGTGGQNAAIVTGAVTWTLGAGVNAPQIGSNENLDVSFITFTAPWVIDSTAKTAGIADSIFTGVSLAGYNYNGNTLGLDNATIVASVMGAGVYTINNVGIIKIKATDGQAPVLFTGDTFFIISGGLEFDLVTLAGTARGDITGIGDFGGTTVASECLATIAGCNSSGPINVAAGGEVDLRGSSYNGNASLIGPGVINRTTFTIPAVVTTIAGANPVAFHAPYPDGNYNVNLQLIAGPGNAAVTVTAKTGTGFTINDSVNSGNTFDVTVIHD